MELTFERLSGKLKKHLSCSDVVFDEKNIFEKLAF